MRGAGSRQGGASNEAVTEMEEHERVPTSSEPLMATATEEGRVGVHTPGSPSSSNQLTLLPLCALIFYEVSGGPYGIEVGRTLHARRLLGVPSIGLWVAPACSVR